MMRERLFGGVREPLTFHESWDDLRVALRELWREILYTLGIKL